MNNVSQITKAKRLTEEEVHAAAEELQLSGVKVSSIEVYKYLGRGSLTTITNFLKTWRQDDFVTALPALVSLPDALSKAAEHLIIKLWSESQALAEQEINSHREILKQAEALANEKIAEAEAFSEEQSKQIEALEAQIEELKAEKAKDHDFFLSEEKRLQREILGFKKSEGILEQRVFESDKQLKRFETKIKELEQDNKSLAEGNIDLKTKLEAAEQRYIEIRAQIDKVDKRLLKTEAESKKIDIVNEVQKNQIDQLSHDLNNQKEIVLSEQRENKALREKAARLEGELLAWKSISPEKTPIVKVSKQVLKGQKELTAS